MHQLSAETDTIIEYVALYRRWFTIFQMLDFFNTLERFTPFFFVFLFLNCDKKRTTVGTSGKGEAT